MTSNQRMLTGLTDGVSEVLQVCELLVMTALLHSGLDQLCLVTVSLVLLLQLPVPGREGEKE